MFTILFEGMCIPLKDSSILWPQLLLSAMNLLEVVKVLNLTTLLKYLDATGLSTTLKDEQGPFTLFAPTDKAFDALPDSTKQSLLEDPAKLKELLAYHMLPERKWTYQFGKDSLVNSLNEPDKLRLNSFRYGKVWCSFYCPLWSITWDELWFFSKILRNF